MKRWVVLVVVPARVGDRPRVHVLGNRLQKLPLVPARLEQALLHLDQLPLEPAVLLARCPGVELGLLEAPRRRQVQVPPVLPRQLDEALTDHRREGDPNLGHGRGRGRRAAR